MSAKLAVPDGGPLTAGDAARITAQLREVREYVRTCSLAEAMDARNKAEITREWARTYRAAAGETAA